jgi:F5/8 type C domain
MSSTLTSRLREFFWLQAAERRLQARAVDLRRKIRSEVESAALSMLAADELKCSRVALELAERALGALLPAVAAAHGQAGAAEWPSIEAALAHATRLPGAPRHERALAHASGAARPPSTVAYAELARAFAWLEAQVDTRTARELRVVRWLRRAALVFPLALIAWQAFGAHNLARGAAVSASSSCGLEAPPPLGKDRLFRLVDGRRQEPTFALCTKYELSPWVTVDLGRSRRIEEVVVYSRADCCWGRRDLPISVQLSLDNQEFETVATRSEPFSAEFPWRLSVDDARARYVRLLSPSRKPSEIVLSELEVYGH